MFKLESYITPILLSYVDKYINNFRPEDSQVSLWGGDASFHNLDLRLEVLEQELQLPFTFVSGHIHELLIHVPWTKLASEPITITINTIECVLKLRNEQTDTASGTTNNKENRKKSPRQKQEIVAPPGYVQSLINKIVSNISINCNNLILKYVEEDIVVSMNIKLLTFQSANEKWQPAFTDLTAGQVMLRKLINLTDLTVCLDKRNASGKIDVYQEPVLYRCSMEMHLVRNYHRATSKKISITRLDIYCHSMEFSLTEQQIPMMIRIIMLLLALQGKQIKNSNALTPKEELEDNEEDIEEALSSWVGWAWSFVPSILPMSFDDEWNKQNEQKFSDHSVQIGFYVDNATITFKISEGCNDHSYYGPRKLKYIPLLKLEIKECFFDMKSHGPSWTNVQFGVSYLLLMPQGYCTCGVNEGFGIEDAETSFYIKAGNVNDGYYKRGSLFDVNCDQNESFKKMNHLSWDYHLASVTEAILLEKSPAFAMDYLYQLELPEDFNSEKLSEIGSDLEYSNLSEKAICRFVLGSLILKIGSGLIHRISTIRQAAAMYDYPPYVTHLPDPPVTELQPPSEDDFDALNTNIPLRIYQLTSFKPQIEFLLIDHPYFEATKRNLFRKRKMSTSLLTKNSLNSSIPRITIEYQCLDAKFVTPIYPNRLVFTTCQLPKPPLEMFNACYRHLQIKVLGAFSQIIGFSKQIKLLMPTNISYNSKTILKPQYWINSDISHYERSLSFDSLTLTVTKVKFLVVIYIIKSFINTDESSPIFNSTLLNDAFSESALPHLELCVEDIKWNYLYTVTTVASNFHIGSVKCFIIEMQRHNKSKFSSIQKNKKGSEKSFLNEPQQVMILSGPESNNKDQDTELDLLFTAIVQYSLEANNQCHPPVIMFKISEMKMSFDPLFNYWMQYQPFAVPKCDCSVLEPEVRRNRSLSEISNNFIESSRRIINPQESVHGSSEKDQILTYRSVASVLSKDNEDISINSQENTFDMATFVNQWYFLWGSVLLYADISQCTVIFPTKPLYAVGVQSIQEALDLTLEKEENLEVIVINLPQITLRNSMQQKNFLPYLNQLPVKVPESIWIQDKINFPLIVSFNDISCYSIQHKTNYFLLKSLSCNATIAFSPKHNESIDKSKQDEKYTSPPTKKGAQTSSKLDSKVLLKNIDTVAKSNTRSLNSIAICIHMDMSPLTVSISEEQISLLATTLFAFMDIFSNLFFTKLHNSFEPPQSIAAPVFDDSSPTISQAVRENTADFVSQYTASKFDANEEDEDRENLKISAWFQWTIARVKVKFFTHDLKTKQKVDVFLNNCCVQKLKMVLDAEDIMTSIDLQNVYMKIKSKVSSASIKHYVKSSHEDQWTLGSFSGLIMQGRDDIITSSQLREDQGGFINITITRARCGHVHDKWKASYKQKGKQLKSQLYNSETINSDRYLSEVVIAVQPVDFVISLDMLHSFLMLLEPFFAVVNKNTDSKIPVSNTLNVNTNSLPLLYLDCREIRIIVPSSKFYPKPEMHDVYILQVSNINIKPNAENPIGRSQLRSDIYQQASQFGILYIPGSLIEDRQYQINISSISMSTGLWNELFVLLNFEASLTCNLHTMNENPALEWNNLGRNKLGVAPSLDLLYIINRFDLCVIIAPAIIYNNTTVCGHAIEVNCVSDAEFSICSSQLILASSIVIELLNFLEALWNVSHKSEENPNMCLYKHSTMTYSDMQGKDFVTHKISKDSGIETNELSTDTMDSKNRVCTNITTETSSSNQLSMISDRSMKMSSITIPLDFFVTGRNVTITLYKFGSVKFKDLCCNSSSVEDMGYQASEEGSQEDSVLDCKRSQGLIFLSISQPNAFYTKSTSGYKIKLSLYDLKIKMSEIECKTVKGVPVESDFGISLLETKPGDPDINTGILPAFLNVQFSKDITKSGKISIDISRPTKMYCSFNRILHLVKVKNEILEGLKYLFVYMMQSGKPTEILKVNTKTDKNQVYTKFKLIKEKVGDISSVDIKCSQLICTLITKYGSEINISCGKLISHMSVIKRPERITSSITFESITMGICYQGNSKMLLNPWSFTLDLCLFWESWQNVNSDPQLQISVDSDCITVDFGSDHFKSINIILKEYKEIINHFRANDVGQVPKFAEEINKPLEKEQHYKDDLRAGAFQFLDFDNEVVEDLPLPYQVVFTKQPEPSMAWRYPQPRVLTKVRVFPVPFKLPDQKSSSKENLERALCRLDYWSECRGTYIPHIHFLLSESEMCQLNLPTKQPQPAVACIWRVVMLSSNFSQIDYDQAQDLISPQALAACIRIDSYYNPAMVPKIQFSIKISAINFSFYNHIDKQITYKMPSPMKTYQSDGLISETQWILSISLELIGIYMAFWNKQEFVFEIEGSLKSDILNYAFLSKQSLIEPFNGKFTLNSSNNLSIKLMTEPIDINFGPCMAHTLVVSSQIWNQNLNLNKTELTTCNDLIIMSYYVICNNTNIPIRFGQVDSDEAILLHSNFSHLYCWYSQKNKQLLRIGIEENEWLWSEPFSIDSIGTITCPVKPKSGLIIAVAIKSLSETQKQVILSGQLIVYNMLQEQFEIKVLPNENEDKEKVFKNTSSYVITGKSCFPSLVVNTNKKISLRIRYFGLESAWSGDIPLIENAKCHQPWLVKVPLKDRGQYLSVWCRITVENNNEKRILAVLWPLFMLRSNFPINVDLCIRTPTLNITLETNVKGRGEVQQLYCPGTTDHSHQLTFLFKGKDILPNQYIPLNYSLINQKEFFKKSNVDSIDEILHSLEDFKRVSWPYADMENTVWNISDQPLTHIQVNYQKFHKYSSTLLLEISPWCLILNTLGCSIAVIVEGEELFRVAHNTVFAPPKLEGTFNIGVGLNEKWHISYPLQIATTGNTSFYMPKIAGLIPNKGHIKIPIHCDDHLCMMTVSNEKYNDMKIVQITSSHIIANYSSYTLSVFCMAVLTDIENDSISPDCIVKNSLIIPPNDKNVGIPILQWYVLENGLSVPSTATLHIVVFIDNKFGYSCPVRVDHNLLRYSIAVPAGRNTIPIIINVKEHKNQLFISLHNDKCPQLLIENHCDLPITCIENREESDDVKYNDLFNWMLTIYSSCTSYYTMPSVNEKFPEIVDNYRTPKLLIGLNGKECHFWSPGINVTESNEQYVRIPTVCDLKVVVKARCHTTLVIINSISQVEISAGDIRNRLQLREDMYKEKFDLVESQEDHTCTPQFEVSTFSSSCEDPCAKLNLNYRNVLETEPKKNVQSKVSLSKTQKMPTITEKICNSKNPVNKVETFVKNESCKCVHKETKILEQTSVLIATTVDVKIFIKNIMFTLTDHLLNENVTKSEVATLTCDNLLFNFTQAEEIDVLFSVSDFQFDNQLYSQGRYDFPVVLISQEPSQEVNFPFSLNFPLEQVIATTVNNPLFQMRVNMEVWIDQKTNSMTREITSIKISLKPFRAYVEDTFFMTLSNYLTKFIPTKFIFSPKCVKNCIVPSNFVKFPENIVLEAQSVVKPLILQRLEIEPLSIMLSVHSSVKFYIALDHSPLHFNSFSRHNIVSTPYRLGHVLTIHYLSETIFGAGWLIGSLEILGSPSGLALSLGSGIHDFVNLPYQGILQGPWEFLVGITQGSASLLTHITAGTLNSVSKLAASVARNIDRITFDDEHLKRTERLRRQRPQGLAQGLTQGLTGLGISLLGAVGGLAHHPLQTIVTEGASPSSLALGIGRGIVGAFTKPISGAAELLALTGQGLLHDTGWDLPPIPRRPFNYDSNILNIPQHFSWKLIQSIIGVDKKIIFIMDATLLAYGTYESVTLVLTNDALVIINMDEELTCRMISLSELRDIEQSNDPTVLYLHFIKATDNVFDNIEMDSEALARVADYIRNSRSLVEVPACSQSQLSSAQFDIPISSQDTRESIQPSLIFNVNPQFRNYFLSLLALIKRQSQGKGFPVL